MNFIKIGKFIAESRKKKKLTQEQLADRLGVNNRTISRWENGKNMPDVSLYKLLCEVLDISIEELINGEKTSNNCLKQSYEKAIINTIDVSEKEKKHMSKLIKLLLAVLIIILISVIFIITYYRSIYPEIDIYNMKVIYSDENKLNENITLDKYNYKVWFYGIDSLQLGDINNNYYDLKSSLKYRQVTIDEIKNYFETQYVNGNIEKYSLQEDKINLYKTSKYEVIICNTSNKDIYIGTPGITNNLKGEYCGKTEKEICTFTRTYHILNIENDDDYNYINVTLKQFQGEVSIVKILRDDKLKVGKNYEFVFSSYEMFEDNINNIFEYSNIIEVKETDKVGLEQINEKLCFNT